MKPGRIVMLSVLACSTPEEAAAVFREMLAKRMQGLPPARLADQAHALRSDILFSAGHYEASTSKRVAELFSPLADDEIRRASQRST